MFRNSFASPPSESFFEDKKCSGLTDDKTGQNHLALHSSKPEGRFASLYKPVATRLSAVVVPTQCQQKPMNRKLAPERDGMFSKCEDENEIKTE